ncbi:hypothetical protein SRABI106_03085 [Rahnella aquatilis]|nr:hypothetical protein SRABI106_03085 [Rahnella aquatilis]
MNTLHFRFLKITHYPETAGINNGNFCLPRVGIIAGTQSQMRDIAVCRRMNCRAGKIELCQFQRGQRPLIFRRRNARRTAGILYIFFRDYPANLTATSGSILTHLHFISLRINLSLSAEYRQFQPLRID